MFPSGDDKIDVGGILPKVLNSMTEKIPYFDKLKPVIDVLFPPTRNVSASIFNDYKRFNLTAVL